MENKIHIQNDGCTHKEKEASPTITGNGSPQAHKQFPASIEEIFTTYYDYLKSYHPRAHDLMKKSKKHHQFFFGLEKITPNDIVAYQKNRMDTKRGHTRTRKTSKATVEKELQYCYSAFTRAINAGLTDCNPFEKD